MSHRRLRKALLARRLEREKLQRQQLGEFSKLVTRALVGKVTELHALEVSEVLNVPSRMRLISIAPNAGCLCSPEDGGCMQAECVRTQRTGAAARESLRRDRPVGLASLAFHACGSAGPFHTRGLLSQ